MYDPSMRVLTVLEVLQARERVTAGELAAVLEVSVRSVQRYVARLQDLGIPVSSTRGPGASYSLRPGFRLPPLMFTTDEAFALSLGLSALSRTGGRDLTVTLAGVRGKVERVLPVAVRDRVQRALAGLELEGPQGSADVSVPMLLTLSEAVASRRRVRLVYRARDVVEASEREVEPLGVLQVDRRWFLAAQCLLRQEARLFRVDRVARAVVCDETFELPALFDVRAFVYEKLAFAFTPWRLDVWVGLPPQEVVTRLPPGLVLVDGDGVGSRLRGGAPELEVVATVLLGWGCEVRVSEPAELREAFRRVAERALAVTIRGGAELLTSDVIDTP